jgi:hypothetical protein
MTREDYITIILMAICIAIAILAALLLPLQAEAADAPPELRPVRLRPSLCRVILFEDGSWMSPDYQFGDPWPPPCVFVVIQKKCDRR